MTLDYIRDRFKIGDRLVIEFTTVSGTKERCHITLEKFKPDYALGEGIGFWCHGSAGGYRSNICTKEIEFIGYDYDEEDVLINI
jgi:hypothetical protein